MNALEALERSKIALTSASARHSIGAVEHKYHSAVLLQLHYRLHRRRARIARYHAYAIGGQAHAAARKICRFFRSVLARRRPPPLPPLMRLRTLNRSLPRVSQAMSLQRAAGASPSSFLLPLQIIALFPPTHLQSCNPASQPSRKSPYRPTLPNNACLSFYQLSIPKCTNTTSDRTRRPPTLARAPSCANKFCNPTPTCIVTRRCPIFRRQRECSGVATLARRVLCMPLSGISIGHFSFGFRACGWRKSHRISVATFRVHGSSHSTR